MKYTAEENVKNSIAGIFLIAAPYWGLGGWQDDKFKLDKDHAAILLKAIPIFFHYSRDETVPFTHLALHAQKFP